MVVEESSPRCLKEKLSSGIALGISYYEMPCRLSNFHE